MKCDKCGKETFLPFTCPYCKGSFCTEDRLPENHACSRIDLARSSKELAPESFEYKVTYSPERKKQRKLNFKLNRKDEISNYPFTYSPLGNVSHSFHFSTKEILHLIIAAALVVGVGLSLVLSAFNLNSLSLALFVFIFTASFLVHEFAHKIVAQRSGFWAEFRLTGIGAVLTLISVISPLKFISPGAVMISGMADRKSIGKMAVAGPLINIALSLTFFAGVLFLPAYSTVFALAMAFNAFISLFNLIPFSIFDGLKVFNWDKRIWCVVFLASFGLTLYSYSTLF